MWNIHFMKYKFMNCRFKKVFCFIPWEIYNKNVLTRCKENILLCLYLQWLICKLNLSINKTQWSILWTLCVCICHQVGERAACCSDGGEIYKHIKVVLQFLPLKSPASFDPVKKKQKKKTEKPLSLCLSLLFRWDNKITLLPKFLQCINTFAQGGKITRRQQTAGTWTRLLWK